MMKRKTIVWTLILLLVLGALSGCKQENSLESAAPGDVVEKPEMDLTEQDTPVSGDSVEEKTEEQEEKTEETSSNEALNENETKEVILTDYYVCNYYVKLKDEFIGKDYTVADFSEINSSKCEVSGYTSIKDGEKPRSYILTMETSTPEEMFVSLQKLQERTDLAEAYISVYTVYQVEKDAVSPPLPSLERNLIEGTNYTDGVVYVNLNRTYFDDQIIRFSDFEELNPDGIEVIGMDSEKIIAIKLYVKERGANNLEKLITQFERREDVNSALLYSEYDGGAL